ncbi:MAG: response regulator with CheY-like receiver domain and winged-helix DNA-binding domain [Verrucomicrobiales bacterium]|nr:response regulator with CheY-like receiver domain and winged-helix DNA-binding domain [Verrucomicrobiales bacterium]
MLVEDEADDVFMMRRAVQRMNDPISLQVAKDGEQAVEYLSGQNQYADRALFPLPSLILLDIKMPRKNGLEVMEWLHSDVTLKGIAVVMVSSSKVKSDVERCRVLGVRAYLVKPVSFDELKHLLTAREEFLSLPR